MGGTILFPPAWIELSVFYDWCFRDLSAECFSSDTFLLQSHLTAQLYQNNCLLLEIYWKPQRCFRHALEICLFWLCDQLWLLGLSHLYHCVLGRELDQNLFWWVFFNLLHPSLLLQKRILPYKYTSYWWFLLKGIYQCLLACCHRWEMQFLAFSNISCIFVIISLGNDVTFYSYTVELR